jgi:F-type H+-transporting ATPase subunit gamma
MEMYRRGEVDRVELIYHHFKNKGSQELIHEPFLPIELQGVADEKPATDYIVEPDRITMISLLIPKVLKMNLFTAHLDAITSEHAARMTAMQLATDNAEELTDELTLEYNKLRQQSITNELLDIVGSSFGQHS